MDEKLLTFIAPRIKKHCAFLFDDGLFKESAREALVQVEKALKEKGKTGNKHLYGVRLINNLFKGKEGVLLKVPLGEELQEKAKKYFDGVFSYYRNYAAHDGSLIDEKIALRILVLASDLLELIESSELTLSDRGGIKELVRIGDFGSEERLYTLLGLLNGYGMPESMYDGLFEMLGFNGFDEDALEQVIILGLLEIRYDQAEIPNSGMYPEFEEYEWFELTEMGKEVMQNLKKKAPNQSIQ
ncbi:TIGR02391 family protein [candidate division KSB1 bacterium]